MNACVSWECHYFLIKYISCDFVVDTDGGPTLIQSLIEPDAVSSIVEELDLNDMTHEEKTKHT